MPTLPTAHLHKSKSEVLVEVRGGEISGHGQRRLGEQLAVLTNLLALEKHLERHLERVIVVACLYLRLGPLVTL